MITDSVCVRHFDLFAIYCQKFIQYFYNSHYMNTAKNYIPIWILMVFMNSKLFTSKKTHFLNHPLKIYTFYLYMIMQGVFYLKKKSGFFSEMTKVTLYITWKIEK